jgi:4'-phosphopantetheinyl transferase
MQAGGPPACARLDRMKPAPEPLEPDEVRVYYACCDTLESGAVERCLELISSDERARYQRFHFEHDRHSYLAAHALTRAVLAPLAGQPAPELQFEAGPHGRPELCQPVLSPRLRFNLSHTRGLVACAVALEHAVGVDVEHVDRRADIEQLAPAVFSERERAELLELEDADKRARFFRLWTLKEAYIKAVGKGLSLPLRSITLELPFGEQPRLLFAAPLCDDGAQWWLDVHAPRPGHVLAVALHVAPPVRATIHEWTPWERA